MARQIGRLRAWAEHAAIAPLWAPLRAMPLERAVRFGSILGAAAAKLDRLNRDVLCRNLEIAFPDQDALTRRSLCTRVYRNFGRMAAEWVHFRDLNPANIEHFVTYAGRTHWDAAIRASDGRGILVLTGHFGNFELLSLAHSIQGNRIAIVHRPLRNPLLDATVADLRRSFGNVTVARKGAAREVLRLLKENWMVAVPLDLDVRHGVFVDFFSLAASTGDGLARLAMATGAPVLPAFMVREGASARHRITILPMIELVKNPDRVAAVRENTQRFTSTIEMMIRRYPDHWNWIHRRWKTRPAGEPRFY
ncbi:MAG: lysophospholipid acyltransferase family protein [Candidatus Binataceae bacterium]